MEIGMSVGVLYQIKEQTNGLNGPEPGLLGPNVHFGAGPGKIKIPGKAWLSKD